MRDTLLRYASTVLALSTFDLLAGQERRLRQGEQHAFPRSRGEIRALDLLENAIVLRASVRLAPRTSADH